MLALALASSVRFTPASATIGNDDYPNSLKTAAQDSVVDPWGFYNCECTSFVAWRLNNDNNFTFSNNMNGGHFGYAYQWKQNAINLFGGSVFNNTPAKGAVAWYDSGYHEAGSQGHVAYVDSINSDGSINIEQYNKYPSIGGYLLETIAPGSSSWPSGFLHFKDLGTSGIGTYKSAFQANNGYLYTLGPSGGGNTQQGMKAGTSPASATLGNGSQVLAFQANNGYLYVGNPSSFVNTRQGMMAGTSPSIAASGNSYRVAFQANNGYLYTYDSSSGVANTTQGMKAGTSPSITALSSGGYQMAFQANSGYLYSYGSAAKLNTQQGMMAGTSPSIATASGGGYGIAFQANSGYLYTYGSSTGPANTTRGMKTGTSPSISR